MRWKSGRRSQNIEDRRGRSGRRISRGSKMSIIGIVFALGAAFFAKDFGPLLNLVTGSLLGSGTQQVANSPSISNEESDQAAQFVSVVLADTEDTWTQIFKASGQRYQAPKLVLYNDRVESACGVGSSQSGPFYCPGDSKVYLDLSFLSELKRLGAGGDFAVAYVIAHEIGHHIQNLEGTSSEVRKIQSQLNETQANQVSVMVELQADCYAGVWAHHAHKQRQVLEQGDIEEAMNAAASVGDDRLQRMSGRDIQPESFTHGTAKQRQQWFDRGIRSGDTTTCNTYAGLN